jgi:hypothetical protein
MSLIRSGKIIHDAEEHDMKCRVWKVGKYSESYKPELLKWAEQQCSDAHNFKDRKPRTTEYVSGGGKKQREAERQKLILEIENG